MRVGNSRAGRKKPATKEVKSAALFTNIGGIDDDTLRLLLEEIVNGHATLQKLNEKCALIKARMRVQTAVLQDQRVVQEDWSEAKKMFPMACHDGFVERWAESIVREGRKKSESMPETFFVELERRIVSDKAQAARGAGAVAAGPVHLILIFFPTLILMFLFSKCVC